MQKKIKILHIQESIGGGGVERRRLSLAKNLDKEKFEQKFICTFEGREIPNEIRAEGFEVIPIGLFKSPFHWSQHKKVQKVISDFQPDIIHGAVFEGVAMAAINGWLKKVPVIIIEETSDPLNRSWKGNLLMKLFSIMADKVVGVSEGVKEEYLKKQLKLSDKKAIAINNGVAVPRKVNQKESEEAKRKYGITEKDFVVGSIGRMQHDSHKRFSDLIKAFAQFSVGKENVKLLLVGDGAEKPKYERLVTELGISEKVIFAGYQSDVTLFYQMMNVFSLVSAREAFGLVLAEAMLNKLPVLATRVGGMKYIVDEGETGFLVDPKDVKGITEKLEIMYSNPEVIQKFSDKGYQKAILNYTEEMYVEKVEKLYLELFQSQNLND